MGEKRMIGGGASLRNGGLRIDSWDDIPHAIALLQRMGEPASCRVPLLQALYHGSIAYLDVGPSTPNRLVKSFLGIIKKPTVVILADDTDAPAGPAGIASTERLMRWARRIIIHGTGGERWQYEAAAALALSSRRLLFIECPSRLIGEYQVAATRWARGALVQTIQPFRGQSHPAPIDPATLQ